MKHLDLVLLEPCRRPAESGYDLAADNVEAALRFASRAHRVYFKSEMAAYLASEMRLVIMINKACPTRPEGQYTDCLCETFRLSRLFCRVR